MLKDAVVIVTGAGSGIGEATAEAFARAGAHIVVSGRRAELLESVAERARAHGVQALVKPLDVSDQEAAERCVQETLAHFCRLDVVAHVAGMNTPQRTIGNISDDNWRRVIDVNLSGVFYFVRAALPTFRAAKRGSFVIVGSDSGLRAGEMAGVAYCASKFGVTSLVQSINIEERRHGIRASVIQAGEVETPIMSFRPAPPPPESRKLMLRSEDVANAIIYVASQPPGVNLEEIIIRPTLDRNDPNSYAVYDAWQASAT